MSSSTGAPSWVSYGGLIVALFALLTALGALRISYLTYRAGGARGFARITEKIQIIPGKSANITMTVINKGRGETSLVGFYLHQYGSKKPVLPVASVGGPELPFRLAGSSQQPFSLDILPALREYTKQLSSGSLKVKSSWPDRVYFSVAMGDGRLVRSRIRYGANEVIARAGVFTD